MSESTERLRFGQFVFDPVSGELNGPNGIVRLAPQVGAVLSLLARRAGEVVGRGDFHELLWPDTTVEFDQGLNFCIRQLRLALSDDADQPQYIETLPRRGYRFVAVVSRAEAAAPPELVEVVKRGRRPRGVRAVLVRVAAVATVIVVAAVALTSALPRRSPPALAAPQSEILAVLSFDLMPPDSSLAGFRASLVEQLVTSLTKERNVGPGGSPVDLVDLVDLTVMGPSFTNRFPGTLTSPDSVRAALGATYLLSGALRRTPAGTRVFAQLIRLADRKHVFAAVQFDSTASTNETSRLTAIADSIARGVRYQIIHR